MECAYNCEKFSVMSGITSLCRIQLAAHESNGAHSFAWRFLSNGRANCEIGCITMQNKWLLVIWNNQSGC